METTPTFDELIDALRRQHASSCRDTVLATLSRFNKAHEATMRFASRLTDTAQIDALLVGLHSLLTPCLTLPSSTDEAQWQLASECLSTIRILSRDTDLVRIFDAKSDDLLATVQRLANLADLSDVHVNNGETLKLARQQVCVDALKAISNLIYNSGYVQTFYVRANVADTIIGHLKSFDVELLSTPPPQASSLAATMFLFDLRIMFLLTTFNRELRIRLDRLQVRVFPWNGQQYK
jgi:hypothetical protein